MTNQPIKNSTQPIKNSTQPIHYGEYLLSLSNEQYWEIVTTTEVGRTLHSNTVKYAKIHHPHIIIE